MSSQTKRIALILLVVALGIGIFHAPIMRAVTASFDMTVQIVSSTGTVLGGVASATSASFDRTVRVVDSTGKVLDSLNSGPAGVTTLTAHGFVIGEGTSALVATAACASGSIPYGQGAADPICSTLIHPNAATLGDLIAATSTNSLGSIADVAVNQVLASGGVGALPAYTATPTISGANITALNAGNISTGTLVTGRGGTGQTTGATSFCMGTSATIAAANTDFIACGENPGVTVIATETNDQQLIPAVCTISNLSVKLTAAANTNVPVITVDKNTTGQTLTCTVANTATTCTDVTHSFTTAAGDLLSVKLVNPAGANATGVVYMAFQINC